MSRIGKRPVDVPDNVKIGFVDKNIVIEGPLGKLNVEIKPQINVRYDKQAKKLFVERKNDSRFAKAMHGTTRVLIQNAIVGITKGYEKRLMISGIGYNASIREKDKKKYLVMMLGYSHPIIIPLPEDLQISCPSPTSIVVKGIDKQRVSSFAVEIKRHRPMNPYVLKGIKLADEVIRKKEIKKIAGA
jgi:large subunit ribosomal protein L6